MPGRLYRAGALEPIASFGEKVLLLGPAGVIAENSQNAETWFEVVFCEPVFGQGNKGVTLLWTQAGAAPAGYSLPASGAAQGTIVANGQAVASPSVFQMQTHQLLQFRWSLRVIGGLNGNAVDDIDVQLNLPPGQPRFSTLSLAARWNSRFQPPEPSDTAQGPAQGANQTAPAAAGYGVWDYLNMNEAFVYEQTYLPSFTIFNNGGAPLNAAGSAIGIDIWGYRMDLAPIPSPDPDWRQRYLLGAQRMCPPEFAVVPIAGRIPGAPVTS